MKATILTIAISVLSLTGLVNNASAANGEKVYRNEVMDEATNTKTITMCKGENDIHLTPVKMHEIKYNEAGEVIGKVIYKRGDNSWTPVQRYEYSYNNNGQLALLSYVSWDKNNGTWSENVSYTAYINDSINDNMLTVVSK